MLNVKLPQPKDEVGLLCFRLNDAKVDSFPSIAFSAFLQYALGTFVIANVQSAVPVFVAIRHTALITAFSIITSRPTEAVIFSS